MCCFIFLFIYFYFLVGVGGGPPGMGVGPGAGGPLQVCACRGLLGPEKKYGVWDPQVLSRKPQRHATARQACVDDLTPNP